MIKLLLTLGTAAVTLILLRDTKTDNQTDTETVFNTDNTVSNISPETVENTVTKTVPDTIPQTDKTVSNTPIYKRGHRFTCLETGEELQVRAVGGRPRKN